MKDQVLRCIKKLQNDKIEAKISPIHVPEVEILALINKASKIALKQLIKEGKIKEVNVINGKSYEVI